MRGFVFSLAWPFVLLLASSLASAAIVKRTFIVKDITVRRMCRSQVITVVNGRSPGPTIHAREGDTVIIHAFNKSPYNLTLHWHGILQYLTPWSDGPEYVTQCPIPPNGRFTYKFHLTGQEGTFWWHAHSSFLRATVHGALIIKPRLGNSYPFPKVYKEVPLIVGEWYNTNVEEVLSKALDTGNPAEESVGCSINGFLGDLYNCSQDKTYNLKVKRGKTYLLRIINAALNPQLFFKIANHSFTVVAMDAIYTEQYNTDVVVIAPGQTVDVLLRTNQVVGSYYMVFTPYRSSNIAMNNLTTRGVLVYDDGASKTKLPIMPILPDAFDTPTAHKFYTNVTGLTTARTWTPIPRKIDEHMYITFGFSLDHCIKPGPGRCVVENSRLSVNMNNESFVLPKDKGYSLLEAFYKNVSGVYTKDFPNQPQFEYNYTDPSLAKLNSKPIVFAPKSTKVKTLKFNSTIQIVLQNTAVLGTENHPIHIHGFNFHVLAQGFGNYNATRDEKKFNFVNPQIRNTIANPVGGWSVLRFQANNPGIWLVHCHLEIHVPWGMAMAFEVENGPTPSTKVPPPPANLPKC